MRPGAMTLALIALLIGLGVAQRVGACPSGTHEVVLHGGARACRPNAGRVHGIVIGPAGASRHDVVVGVPVHHGADLPHSISLTPLRAYLRAVDIPPPGIGAYGVVSFRAKPTPATRARLLMVCEAFKASLPPQSSASVPPADQMLTIWPLDDPQSPAARADDCNFLVDHYDLLGGIQAIQDAERQGANLDGDGPYLIGWSPSTTRGVADKLVLVVNMSGFEHQDRFDHAFVFWQRKVVEDPRLWREGFSLDELRLDIRDFVDTYGDDLVKAITLFGKAG